MDKAWSYWCLLLIHLICTLLECVSDLLFSFKWTTGSKGDRLKAQKYEHSAQVVQVHWRAHYQMSVLPLKRNFLYSHDRYVHPNYILEHNNVTLLQVCKHYAIFCVTDPNVDVFDTKQNPFMFISQFELSQKLVFLPIESFHRLAKEVGDPNVPVMVCNTTAR